MYSGTAAKVLDALRAHDVKEDGQGRYRSNSPLRPGSNSHGFTLTLDDDEHGAYFDHVSHEAGSLYDLARALGVELPTVTSTKRGYGGIDDYAAAHGITADHLRAAGWYETIYHGRSALAFKTATGTRWRFLDGQKPYYTSPKGYQRSWYGLTASAAKKLGEGGDLVIANGEISTVVARQYGLAAACVTAGEKGIPPDLVQELKAFLGDDPPPITVAFDCDDTGRRAGKLIARQLRDSGLIARAVDLGLSTGGDLADFCMTHKSDTARALAALPAMPLDADTSRAGESDYRTWYIIPASDLKNLPPIEWIVEGEIPARGITVLFGPSGSGKSFIALDYALRVAQTDPVLYMVGEGEYGYQQRVAAWTKHHNLTEGKLYMVIGAVQFLEDNDFTAFQDAVSAIRPRLVIVDTLARSMIGSDENSTRDMGMFMQACEDIKRRQDTAIMLVHHTNKGGQLERGSSALRGASDSMIKVFAQDDLITIESAKTKDSKPFSTRYMQIVPVEVTLHGQAVESAVMIEADKVFQGPSDPLTQHQEKVLRCLSNEMFGASRQEIADMTAIPYFSLQRILNRLKTLKFVDQSAKTEPYAITDEGRDRLALIDGQTTSDQGDQVFPLVDRLDRIDRVDRTAEKGFPQISSDQGDQPDQPDQLRLNVDRLDRSAAYLAMQAGM